MAKKVKIVGLTGGIGSGKTTVAKMFASFGIPIYNSDEEAKKLVQTSETIRKQLILLLGEETFKNGKLDRKFMADKIFSDKQLLQKVNAIIHPEVGEHFQKWALSQQSSYVIKEAAILFESESNKLCDVVIMVTAPEKKRIKRVMDRDGVSEMEVRARMDNQWSDARKIELSDYIIDNIILSQTRKQVEMIHSQLI